MTVARTATNGIEYDFWTTHQTAANQWDQECGGWYWEVGGPVNGFVGFGVGVKMDLVAYVTTTTRSSFFNEFRPTGGRSTTPYRCG